MFARVWIALAIVYVVWGSTYLAIRVAIDTMPPLLMGSVRFLVAGALLYAWGVRRGDRDGDRPGAMQWRAAAIVGAALFLGGNGGVVLAERTIASGIAALIVALTPLWMTFFAWLVFGERVSALAMVGLPLGFVGLVLLVGPSAGTTVDPWGALLCALGSIAWSAGSLYARRAPLPARAAVSTGMQMITGGVWLGLASLAAGELGRLHVDQISAASFGALVYLVVAGSLVAFSAYAWLIRTAPVPLVATYAYVNPVVAVALGWLVLAEPITPRMLAAGAVIVVAVVLIASGRRAPAPTRAAPEVETVAIEADVRSAS
jgi:drug/metabolite transporter (DMT)-like permease